jgi:hypothetical protein
VAVPTLPETIDDFIAPSDRLIAWSIAYGRRYGMVAAAHETVTSIKALLGHPASFETPLRLEEVLPRVADAEKPQGTKVIEAIDTRADVSFDHRVVPT